MQGNVEGRFVFSTAVSHHFLPFRLLNPSPVVLPREESNGDYYIVTTVAEAQTVSETCQMNAAGRGNVEAKARSDDII